MNPHDEQCFAWILDHWGTVPPDRIRETMETWLDVDVEAADLDRAVRERLGRALTPDERFRFRPIRTHFADDEYAEE